MRYYALNGPDEILSPGAAASEWTDEAAWFYSLSVVKTVKV